jgi:hypothetical protein
MATWAAVRCATAHKLLRRFNLQTKEHSSTTLQLREYSSRLSCARTAGLLLRDGERGLGGEARTIPLALGTDFWLCSSPGR